MAAKETTLEEIGEMLGHVVKHMATKENVASLRSELKGDIAGLAEQIASIERELKGIRRELDDLHKKFENIAGFRKEIDHAFERIAAIEKHLGLRANAKS